MPSSKRSREEDDPDDPEIQILSPPKQARHDDADLNRGTSNGSNGSNMSTTSADSSSAGGNFSKHPVLRSFYKGRPDCRGEHLLFDATRSRSHARLPADSPIFYDKEKNISHLWMLADELDREPHFSYPMDWMVDWGAS